MAKWPEKTGHGANRGVHRSSVVRIRTVTQFNKQIKKKDRAFKQPLLDSPQNFLLFYIITLLIEALIVN